MGVALWRMGAYKYLQEIWRHKQTDAMRFLLRVRCWELRQLPRIVRASKPSRPDKARRVGYKAKQGFVVYRVRIRRGGRKRPVPVVSPRVSPRTRVLAVSSSTATCALSLRSA